VPENDQPLGETRPKSAIFADRFPEISGPQDPTKGRRGSVAAAGEPAPLELFEREFLSASERISAALAYHTAAVNAGAFARAEAVFSEGLKKDPRSKRLHFLRIDLLLRQGKFHEAMEAIEAAMAEYGVDEGMLAAALSVRQRIGRHLRSRGDCSVSLCMIVKDEQPHLACCLQSVKHLVDEIIVADTGSMDRTRDIAAAFGACVLDVLWEGDFAKARNAALAAASCRWVLVLDADEVISDRDAERFKSLLRENGSFPAAYTVHTRNYTFHASTIGWQANNSAYPAEEKGLGWFPSEKVRLFPNRMGIRFSGTVHELVEPSLRELGIPIRESGIPVHHYGKLDEGKTFEKTRGYRDLGEKKLEHAPEAAAAIRELAIQSSHLNRNAEAAALWERYLEQEPSSAEAHLNLGSACWQLGRYDDALEHAKTARRLNPGSKEAAFNRAIAELLLGKARAAAKTLERLLGRTADYPPARFVLASAYACCGETQRSLAALKPLRATSLGPYLVESFHDLSQRLHAASQVGYCAKLLRLAMEANCSDKRIAEMFEAIRPPA
jgi:tetratricopeptide (TPR) repeat protein